MRTATLRTSTWRYNLALGGLLLGAVLALVLAESGVAFAHARLKSATILPDAVITSVPAALTLTFTEESSPTQTKLQVLDASGKAVDKGDLKVDGANATVSLGTLADGKYTVKFRSFTEEDSAIVEGSYSFTVAKSGTAASGDAGKAAQAESGGSETGTPAGAPAAGQGGAAAPGGAFTIPALLVLLATGLFAGALLVVRRKRQV